MPRLKSSRRGVSALARGCYWRQPDLPTSKRRRETAERTRTSRKDGTYNPSCRYRPLKAISFVSSLDAICGVNRIVRESLRTLNKQRFEKYFNHFRRRHPRRVEFYESEQRRARGEDSCAADRSHMPRRFESRHESFAREAVSARLRARESRNFGPHSPHPAGDARHALRDSPPPSPRAPGAAGSPPSA